MTAETLSEMLVRLDACEGAREWAATQPSAEAAWGSCERPDWMFWLAARTGIPRQIVVHAALDDIERGIRLTLDGPFLPAVLAAVRAAEDAIEILRLISPEEQP